ncbi:MAG: SIS domain-containing protein [bacterium]
MQRQPESFDYMTSALEEAAEMLRRIEEHCMEDIIRIASLSADALRRGGRLFFCGNGGSAAESQHLATELVVRLSSDSTRGAFPALALTTDTSTLTACSNDFGFDRVFARQVEAHLRAGDVLFLLSTSGRSPNLIEAAKISHERQGINIGFLGQDKTPLNAHLDDALHIPSKDSQRVQEGHLLCGHLLVHLIELQLMKSK